MNRSPQIGATSPDRGKRVLMLIENCPYSCDGRVRCEANSLAAAGYHVTVICPWAAGESWHETFDGVEAYQFPPPPNGDGVFGYILEYGYALTITAVLTCWVAVRKGFDLIHAHNPPDFFVVIGGFWRLFGKKFVFDQHDLAPDVYLHRFTRPGNRLIHRVLLFFERLSCRWADHIIATNESYKRIEMDRGGVPASRITVVRNGPEAWHLHDIQPDPSLRGNERIMIGFVGEMGNQDGVDYLLRSLAILKQQFARSDWRCLMIGKGDAMDNLKHIAEELDIADKLQFTGWVDYERVPQYIAAMDICVVPDPSNVFNDRSTIVKIMEYMAQAKAIVAFDLPEHRVTAGDTALYAKPNEELDFAKQILRFMDDETLRRQMGAAGRQRVVDNFTWKHQETQLLNAYRCLELGAPAHAHTNKEHVELVPIKG